MNLALSRSAKRRTLPLVGALTLIVALVGALIFGATQTSAQSSPTGAATAVVVDRKLTETAIITGSVQLANQRTLTLPGIAGAAATTTPAAAAAASASPTTGTTPPATGGSSSSCAGNSSQPTTTPTTEPTTTPITHRTPPTATTSTSVPAPSSTTSTTTPSSTTSSSTTTMLRLPTTTTTTTPGRSTTPPTPPTTTPSGGGGTSCTPSSRGHTQSPAPNSSNATTNSAASDASSSAASSRNSEPVSVITDLAATGRIVRRGEQLWAVNGQPTVLLYGSVALYRTLSPGVTDGADIKMLEQNLAALGFTDSGALTVDEHWTSATTAAVDGWQTSLGLSDTGQVAAGDVVVAANEIRVNARDSEIGAEASAGTSMLDVSTTSVFVSAQARLAGPGAVHVGERLALELNNRVATHGTVTAVSRDVTQSSSTAPPMVTVTIDLDGQASAKGMVQGAPATGTVIVSTSASGPTVPVGALHASSGGASAVTVDDGSQRTHEVAVTPGIWADGLVAVRGDLRAGDRVVLG